MVKTAVTVKARRTGLMLYDVRWVHIATFGTGREFNGVVRTVAAGRTAAAQRTAVVFEHIISTASAGRQIAVHGVYSDRTFIFAGDCFPCRREVIETSPRHRPNPYSSESPSLSPSRSIPCTSFRRARNAAIRALRASLAARSMPLPAPAAFAFRSSSVSVGRLAST